MGWGWGGVGGGSKGIISNLTESKSSISERYEQIYENKLSNLDEFLETHNYQSSLKNK